MALNSDFKVKDSLYVGNSAYFTGCTNTDGEILSSGQPLTDLFIQPGEVAANCDLTTGTGITNITYDGTVTKEISIDSACNTKWNANTTCIGTVVASDISSFTDCTGTVEGVTTTGSYLTGGGNSGCFNIGIDSACAASWNAKTTCTGTTTPSNTQTFTNKSGNISQWTNDSNYTTCLGTITTAGTLLSAGSTTIGIDSGALDYLNQSACAGLNCVGDVTGIDAGTAITVSDGSTATPEIGVTAACNTAWNSAKSLADGLTTCAGLACTGTMTSVGVSDGLESTGGNSPTLGIATACNTKWDQSACAGLLCVGDITEVTTTGDYLTGGGITGAINIGLEASCAIKWDNASAGGVTNVTGGDGIDSSGGLTPSIAVDATVARTDQDETFCCNVTIQGDLTVDGALTCLNTIIEATSAISISNHGTGPALDVEQTGTNTLAVFTDSEGGTICMLDGAKMKITPSSAANAFCVGGDGRITGDTILNGGLTLCGVSAGTDNTVLVMNTDGSVSTDEIDSKVWESKLVDSSSSTMTLNNVPKVTNTAGTIGSSNISDTGTLITLNSDVTIGEGDIFKMQSTSGTVNTQTKVFTSTVGTTLVSVPTFAKSGLDSVSYDVTLQKGVNKTAFKVHAVYNDTAPCGTVYAIVDAQAATQLDEVAITSTGITINLDITAIATGTTATIRGVAHY